MTSFPLFARAASFPITSAKERERERKGQGAEDDDGEHMLFAK